jgi:CheY-like chemotaxis protein
LEISYVPNEALALNAIKQWCLNGPAPDLVLLDMRLPGSSILDSDELVSEAGLRLAKAIRSREPLKDLPILIYSAFPDLVDADAADDLNLEVARKGDDIVPVARALISVNRPDIGRPKRSKRIATRAAVVTGAVVGTIVGIVVGIHELWPSIERWLP